MSNKLLKINAGVLYYEDGTVNGIDDISYDEQKQGVKPRIPCVQATEGIDKADSWLWCIDIDAEDGIILNWEKGIEADVHYKVCDQCEIDYYVGGVKVCDNDVTYIRADIATQETHNALSKESVLNEIYQLEDMVSSLESDVHVSGKIISILTQVTQLIARIDTESLSDEQIMRVLNAIGYEERSWIEHVRKHMAISE